MAIDTVVNLAAEAGKIMLENGGETYRVEQTIGMICRAYNVKDTQSFVTPTAIITSTTSEDGKTSTIIKRITARSIDLNRVAMVNDLSRKLQNSPLSFEDFKAELRKISLYPSYSNFLKMLFAGLITASFTILFGGNIYDFTVAFFAGIIINRVCAVLSRFRVNDFFINIIGGMIAGLIGLFASSLSTVFHEDMIIIGSIMLLVPGLTITNAIRDTIAGDLISGLSRGLEAIVIAGAIAIGAAFSFKLWMYII